MNDKKPYRRNQVFVGGYVPPFLKNFLTEHAKRHQTTVNEVLKQIIAKAAADRFNADAAKLER